MREGEKQLEKDEGNTIGYGITERYRGRKRVKRKAYKNEEIKKETRKRKRKIIEEGVEVNIR